MSPELAKYKELVEELALLRQSPHKMAEEDAIFKRLDAALIALPFETRKWVLVKARMSSVDFMPWVVWEPEDIVDSTTHKPPVWPED